MAVKIIGLIIPEAKKIYTVISIVGGLAAAVCAALLLL